MFPPAVFDHVDRFRKQLVLACTTIVLVIALGASTGVLALRSSVADRRTARAIDSQVVLLEKLRETTREVTASARRYMVSGDERERQRVLAIIDELRTDRTRLDARFTLPYGPALEADLDAFQLAAIDAMSYSEPDLADRLTGFEDRLARARMPLAATFDDVIGTARTRRTELRSASDLGRSAQWTLVLASAIGIMLAIGLCITVLRRITPTSKTTRTASPSQSALLREPFDVTEVIEAALASHRRAATNRSLRLKFEPQPGAVVLADKERVREVLDHLLELAIADGRPSSELVLHVGNGDGGIRIAVIEPGPSSEPSTADPVALLLCRQVIEAHGGRLGVQSSSISRTYWFTLPGEPALLR